MKGLSALLDAEFQRVQKEEGVPMGDLVEEVADLVGCTPRQLYNYRAGKWSLPSDLIPPLCRRFKSRTLLDALEGELADTVFEMPFKGDIVELSKDIVIESVDHHFLIEKAINGNLDRATTNEIDASTEKLIYRYRFLLSIIDAECERKAEQRRRA